MRALILGLVVGAASAAIAQAPTTPTPAQAQASIPKPGGGEFRVGGVMISGERSTDFANNVTTGSGSMQGVDVVLRAKAIGLQIKSLSGTFDGQPNVTSADARILLFPPAFSVMLGAGRRALWSDLNADSPTIHNVVIAGVSSTAVIGGSGLRTNFSAALLAAKKAGKVASTSSGAAASKVDKGLEGEASVLWRLPKTPLYVQVGYRTEVFTLTSGTRTTPEEVRGMKIGGGLVLGGR